jgi:hypothetical protein
MSADPQQSVPFYNGICVLQQAVTIDNTNTEEQEYVKENFVR